MKYRRPASRSLPSASGVHPELNSSDQAIFAWSRTLACNSCDIAAATPRLESPITLVVLPSAVIHLQMTSVKQKPPPPSSPQASQSAYCRCVQAGRLVPKTHGCWLACRHPPPLLACCGYFCCPLTLALTIRRHLRACSARPSKHGWPPKDVSSAVSPCWL